MILSFSPVARRTHDDRYEIRSSRDDILDAYPSSGQRERERRLDRLQITCIQRILERCPTLRLGLMERERSAWSPPSLTHHE
jgi:hypothetical protein